MRFIICFIAFPRKYLLSCSINRKRLKAFRFGHKEFKLCACFGRLAVLLSFPKRSGYIDSVISMMGDPESEEDAFKLICFVKYYMTVRSFSLFPLNISNCRYHHIWRTVKGLGLVATDVMLNTEKRIINHRIRSSFKKYCLLCRFSELFFIEIKKCIFIPLWIRSGHPRPLSADHPLQLLISLNIIRTVIPPSYHHIPFRQ